MHFSLRLQIKRRSFLCPSDRISTKRTKENQKEVLIHAGVMRAIQKHHQSNFAKHSILFDFTGQIRFSYSQGEKRLIC